MRIQDTKRIMRDEINTGIGELSIQGIETISTIGLDKSRGIEMMGIEESSTREAIGMTIEGKDKWGELMEGGMEDRIITERAIQSGMTTEVTGEIEEIEHFRRIEEDLRKIGGELKTIEEAVMKIGEEV